MRFVRKRDDGQAVVLMVLALAVLLGMCAMVLDVGSWFRTQRRLQGTADAAALAGAQQLPDNPSAAQTMALSYANQNGGNVLGSDITVGTLYQANDIIDVTAKKTDSGFFSSVLRHRECRHLGDGKGSSRAARAGSVRRADGGVLRSPPDPQLQRRQRADVRSADPHGPGQDGCAGRLRNARSLQ